MNLNYKAKGLWKEYKVKMATHCNPSGAQWAHTIYTIMVHILVAPPLWIQTAKAPCPKAFQIMCHQKELPWYSTCHKQYRKQQSVSQVQGEQTQQMWCDSHSHRFAPLLLKPMPCIFQCFQWLHQKPWFQGSQRGNWYGRGFVKRKSGYFIPFSPCAKKDSALILEWMGTSTHCLMLHGWLQWNQQKYSARVPPYPLEQQDRQNTKGLSTMAQLAKWVSKIPH